MTLVWSALSVGAIYSLLSITLNVIYTSVGVFNFAQGAILTLGVYVSASAITDWHLPTIGAVALGGLACAGTGIVEARIVLLPRALGRNELLTTVGAATLLTGIIGVVYTETTRSVPSPVSNGVITIFGGRVAADQLFLICAAIAAAAVLTMWYRFTLSGLEALAIAEDRSAARLRGINVTRKSIGAFAFAGAVAGLVGMGVGNQTFAYPELASSLVLYAFVAFVLGSAGSLGGSLLGGFIIGFAQQYSARYIGAVFSDIVVFGLLVAILMVLPNGLFGRASVRTI